MAYSCDRKAGLCLGCGDCCKFEALEDLGLIKPRSLSKDEEEQILIAMFCKTGFIYPHGLSTSGLIIQSYEYYKAKSLSEKEGVDIKLRPNKVIYDAKRDLAIVFDWRLDCRKCPFLAESKIKGKTTACRIYNNRFDICKLFPETHKKIEAVEKRHLVLQEMIKNGELIMPTASTYDQLVEMVSDAEKVNFDDVVKISQ